MQAGLRKLACTASAAALLSLVVSVTGAVPVDATPGEFQCVIVAQPANVSSPSSAKGGLYYPVTDPNIASNGLSGGPSFSWNLNGVCANNGVGFTSSGTGVGWCGRSVGQGSGQAGGRSYTVSWQSLGSQLVLT